MDDKTAIAWIERARDYFTPEFGDEAAAGQDACEHAIQAIRDRAALDALIAAARYAAGVIDSMHGDDCNASHVEAKRKLAAALDALEGR